jgi:hypothetical protein
MPNSSRRHKRIQQQVADLSWAVPQVMNERISRMMLAGVNPSAKDQREFHLMSAEKLAAFSESWMALGMQMWRAQQELSSAWVQNLTQVASGRWPTTDLARATRSATLGVMGAGLAPVHSRALSNARRLTRD